MRASSHVQAPKKIVLIAGTTSSGKTTFANDLAKRLGTGQLNLDNFYKNAADVQPNEDHPEYLDWDAPQAIDWEGMAHALDSILTYGQAEIPEFSMVEQARISYEQEIFTSDTLIIEGFMAFHPTILEVLEKHDVDVQKLFFDADPDIRFERRVARYYARRENSDEPVLSREQQRSYFDKIVRPSEKKYVLPQKAQADIVFDTTESFPILDAFVHSLTMRHNVVTADLEQHLSL